MRGPARTDRFWMLDDDYTGFSRLDRPELKAEGVTPCRRREILARRYSGYNSAVPHGRYRELNESRAQPLPGVARADGVVGGGAAPSATLGLSVATTGETDPAVEARLAEELRSFAQLWEGGFFVGDPLDSMFSPHGVFGYVGLYHAIYHACIRPYVTAETRALELGPGRGAWTRAMLGAREIWCLDALSAEHNRFWAYVGNARNVRYVHVSDFSCSILPDDAFDFLFSYDTLCHVSFDGIEAYVRNLRPKLRVGAHAFVMVADFDKYRRFVDERDSRSVFSAFVSYFSNPLVRRLLESKARKLNGNLIRRYEEFIQAPEANGWFHAGVDRTCELLERHGYRVIEPDVGLDPKSPIVHFSR